MFILDRPRSDKPTYIFIKKKISDGPFKASLETKIHPAFWDKKTQRAVTKGVDKQTAEEHRSINNLLQTIENFVDKVRKDARYDGKHLDGSMFQKKLNELKGKQEPGSAFFEACEAIIEDMKEGRLLTRKGQKYSPGTVKNYGQSLRCIEDFDPKLTFGKVNMVFYREFSKYCIDQNWSANYFGQHVKNVKCLMDEAKNRGLHNNTTYEDEAFRTIIEETEDISLTEEEIAAIYNVICSETWLDRARDWFVLDCYTGLRVGDIQLLEMRNITGDTITIVNEKTDTKVVIPQHPYVKEILKKWDGLPPRLSDTEINRYIKPVAKEAGLTETVIYSLTKGGVRQDFYLQKWEMVSNHTARRSSITNMLEAGITDNQVMQVHGIKKHATLMKYKKTKPKKNAENLKSHPFYTGKQKAVPQGGKTS